MSRKPRTISELFQFYYDRFKPIYDHVQSLNELPAQLGFEVQAAFDHLSRHWQCGEEEGPTVDRVAGHLKRATFDAFKLITRDARDQYNHLLNVDVSVIDNGDFQKQMIQLWVEIKEGAIQARAAEGNGGTPEKWHEAFDLWEGVFVSCRQFEKDFYRNPKIEWARTRQKKHRRLKIAGWIVLSIATGLMADALWLWITASTR